MWSRIKEGQTNSTHPVSCGIGKRDNTLELHETIFGSLENDLRPLRTAAKLPGVKEKKKLLNFKESIEKG